LGVSVQVNKRERKNELVTWLKNWCNCIACIAPSDSTFRAPRIIPTSTSSHKLNSKGLPSVFTFRHGSKYRVWKGKQSDGRIGASFLIFLGYRLV
jgi:hypothetical protein